MRPVALPGIIFRKGLDLVFGARSDGPPPEPVHPLQPFYGVGPGKIAIHFDSDHVTTDGTGKVTGLQNRGGGGAFFDAAVTGAAIPLAGKFMDMSADTGMATADNPADLVGVRFMWVMRIDAYVNQTRLFGGAASTPYGYELRINSNASGQILQPWSNASGGGVTVSPGARFFWPAGTPALFELELNAGTATVYINGVAVGTASYVWTDFLIENIGKGQIAGTVPVVGKMGDVLGVTLGEGADAAIAAARTYLKDRFALALP